MKPVKLNFFEIFSLGWIFLSILGLLLIFAKLFYITFLILAIALIFFIFFILLKKKIIQFVPFSKNLFLVFGIIFFIGLILSIFTAPTIFEGRDEGSYAISGIMMSKHNNLQYSNETITQFFKIYGVGKALNFPGFHYTEAGFLKSQFLPAYSSWIALWHKFFGLSGIQFVNLFPFITFLFSIFLVMKKITQKMKPQEENVQNPFPSAIAIGMIFLLSLFPFVLFYKFTLGEIYFGALLWFSIYLAFRYFENRTFLRYFLIFLPLILLIFARIEAFALIFMFLVVFILKDFENFKKPLFQTTFIFLGILLVTVFSYEPNFFIDSFKNIAKPILQMEAPSQNDGEKSFLPDDWEGLYSLKVFSNYNILPIILMSGAFFFVFLKKRKEKQKEKFHILFPLLIVSPIFIYLIDANISLDHPWFLRRFVFAIIPILTIYSVIFLAQTKISLPKIFWAISILIILNNFILLFPFNEETGKFENFITFRQNKNLLSQTNEISQFLSDKDLLLISRESSGSGWSLISAPLREIFSKQAVYFFNPNDFEKIEKDKFENIYLLTSEKELDLYSEMKKTKRKEFSFASEIVHPSKNANQKPQILDISSRTILFQLEK